MVKAFFIDCFSKQIQKSFPLIIQLMISSIHLSKLIHKQTDQLDRDAYLKIFLKTTDGAASVGIIVVYSQIILFRNLKKE